MDEPRGQDVLKTLTANDFISRAAVFSHSGRMLAESATYHGMVTKPEADRIIRFLVSRDLCESKRMRVFGADYAVQWFDYPRSLKCQTDTGHDNFIVWGGDDYIFVGFYPIDVQEDDAYYAVEAAVESMN